MSKEWLESDGKGGFALGAGQGIPLRSYHSMLTVQTIAGRVSLINSLLISFKIGGQLYHLDSFAYDQGKTTHPNLYSKEPSYQSFPVKKWSYEIPGGVLSRSLVMLRGSSSLIVKIASVGVDLEFFARPYLSLKQHHGLSNPNLWPELAINKTAKGLQFITQEFPEFWMFSNATWDPSSHSNNNVYYQLEDERGLASTESLFSPGYFKLNSPEIWLCLTADQSLAQALESSSSIQAELDELREKEIERRKQLPMAYDFSAEQYLTEDSVLAGFPWFGEWGRDTFIAIRGLLLARGNYKQANKIFLRWSKEIYRGMLPNRIIAKDLREYNSVDASLWYVLALYQFIEDAEEVEGRDTLLSAAETIVQAYFQGTQYGIVCDTDGLIRAGEVGQQLTWMDAKVQGKVITPRIGKPVEIQALWLNVLSFHKKYFPKWTEIFNVGKKSFAEKFWSDQDGYLYDVVEENFESGKNNSQLRPNQLFAVGGLPISLVTKDRASQVILRCEQELFTPYGIRSLAPSDPDYQAGYRGTVCSRDQAYHQGTAWLWLTGIFAEAWLNSQEITLARVTEAREKFYQPLFQLSKNFDGHLPEIAEADSPHELKGSPFQAWSVSELIRLDQLLLQLETRMKKNLGY